MTSATRSTTQSTTKQTSRPKSKPRPKTSTKSTQISKPRGSAAGDEDEAESGDDEDDGGMDKEYDSDALDGSSDEEVNVGKRKRVASTPKKVTAVKAKPVKKPQRKADRDQDEPQKKSGVTPSKRATNAKAKSPSKASTSQTQADESSSEERGDDYRDGDVQEYDSDALDDSDTNITKVKKRKRVASTPKSKSSLGKNSTSPRKRQRKARNDDEDDDEEFDLKEGQEIVGAVVQAPKTGRVPPGRISQNTLDFLTKLKDPKCNDREWFKLHEPVYRLAEQEWKDFIEALTTPLTEVDTQVPPLPPKDVIHRIYRDVRFSNDKTPYKKGLSASFSRSGRKGIFAGYHVAVKPGGESIIAAGSWCPGRNELASIRANIQRSSRRLRSVISAPEFVRYFGEPRPLEDGGRQNVFGMDDELKVAPKGVDKGHKDIDLLKCRSFAVVHRFMDSEVLDPGFVEMVAKVAGVMRPLVHCLNDMMTVVPEDDDSDDDDDAEEGESDGGEAQGSD